MKKKKILLLFLLMIFSYLAFNLNTLAVTLPELTITSNNYSPLNKMTFAEKSTVTKGDTLQLYAILSYGNDYCPDDDNECGIYVFETNLNGVTWTSSNTSIATIDNNGKVTAIEAGKTTITARYNDETYNYLISVISNPASYFSIAMEVKTVGGAITSEQGLVGGSTTVEKGKNLKVYLIPNKGYEIEKVLVDNKAIDLKTLVYEKDNPNAASEDGVAVYTFTNVSKNHTIEVYYKAKTTEKMSFVIMMITGDGGSITYDRESAASEPVIVDQITTATTVEVFQDLKIYICPKKGYKISNVYVDNKAIDLKTLVYEKDNPNAASEDGVAVYTFTNVITSHTIEVKYLPKSFSNTTTESSNNRIIKILEQIFFIIFIVKISQVINRIKNKTFD